MLVSDFFSLPLPYAIAGEGNKEKETQTPDSDSRSNNIVEVFCRRYSDPFIYKQIKHFSK
ncbi:hypothetical protein YC2023_052398 [Brassica napus]